MVMTPAEQSLSTRPSIDVLYPSFAAVTDEYVTFIKRVNFMSFTNVARPSPLTPATRQDINFINFAAPTRPNQESHSGINIVNFAA